MEHLAELEKEEIKLRLTKEETSKLIDLLRDSSDYLLERTVMQQLETQDYFELTEEKPMTYSSFKNLKMVEELPATTPQIQENDIPPIKTQIDGANLFENIPPKKPSEWLKDTLWANKETPMISEKARSEGLIRPILIEMIRENLGKFILFSGETFDVDKDRGLVGECDFLLSLSKNKNVIEAPVFTLVEAKKKSIEEGLGQCGVQMIAAREFNKREGKELSAIFGCVSTGRVWRFLKLEENTLIIDENEFYEKLELDKIIGILQYIIDFYEVQ